MAELNTLALKNDANLVANWRLEGNSLDETANNHDGTDTAITYSTANGKYGQGAGFNGSSSKITVPDAAAFDLTGSYTIVGWINTNVNNATESIWEKYISGNGPYFRLDSTGKLVSGLQAIPQSVVLTGSTVVGTNTWVHVATTYDGTNVRVFLNGVQDGISSSYTYGNGASTALVNIGRRGDSANSNFFNGEMDDISIFSRALTVAEINLLYKKGSSGNFFLLL